MREVVLASTRSVSRSPACAAIHCPIIPPIDSPQNAKVCTPSALASASASRPSSSMLYSAAGASLAP